MRFAKGGIVTRPTIFPFKNGTGLMGEAGPEAVMPLKQLSGGRLGVSATGMGSGPTINIIDQRGAGASPVETNTRRGPDGQTQIDVLIKASVTRLLGSGQLDTALTGNAGTRRPGRF